MLSEDANKDVEFCRESLFSGIKKIIEDSEKLKPKMIEVLKMKMADEILISIVYLKMFHNNFIDKKIQNTEEAWQFMNDIRGVPEKMYYVQHYFGRIEEALKKSAPNG